MILYTMQPIGRDITKEGKPTSEYKDGGAYHELADYLGWNHWLWCFDSLEDFENKWMVFRYDEYQLWTLDIPDHVIKCIALSRQCENALPVEEWFNIHPEIIRECGDIPQVLVPFPIEPSQVIQIQPGSALRDYLKQTKPAEQEDHTDGDGFVKSFARGGYGMNKRRVKIDGKDGVFHQWAMSVVEDDYLHLHSCTVGIIELGTGEVVTVSPSKVTFLEPVGGGRAL